MSSSLRISSTKDVIHRRSSTLLFGPPKVGKTTLLSTIDLNGLPDSSLVYVAADPGMLALRHREFQVLEPTDGKLTKEFLDEVYAYCQKEVARGTVKWIAIDGADAIGNALLRHLLSSNKDGRKAYGEMADIMEEWLLKMRDLKGASFIVITHMSANKLDDSTVEFVPTFPGQKLGNMVNGWFDLIGCMRLVDTGDNTTQRFIQFDPSKDKRYRVGDRSGVLDDYEAPNLGAIFRKIHDSGIETEGKADEYIQERSQDDMAKLAAIAREKKVSVEQVKKMCAEIANGRSPKYTKDEEFKALIQVIERM